MWTGRRALSAAGLSTAVLILTAAPAPADTPVALCVPASASATSYPAITAPNNAGNCPAGVTKQSLARQSDLTAAENRVAALEAILVGITRSTINGQPTLRVSGENVQIVNGTGATGTTNSRGNLFLGYNETPGPQTGSHDLVLGKSQTFGAYSWGSLVGGINNSSTSAAQAIFGTGNRASNSYASILGGEGNQATGRLSTVLGGRSNSATATDSVVAGGFSNATYGPDTAIGGGSSNAVFGQYGWAAGGRGNAGYEPYSAVSGGCGNAAGAQGANVPPAGCPGGGAQSVSGGRDNKATGDFTSVAGNTLAAVVSRGCGSLYDGSDATATSIPTDGRCMVAFGPRDLSHCRSVIEPRPSIGYLTSSDTMVSIAPGEMIGISFGNFPNDSVAVQGRYSNGAYIPASQMGEFKLLVYC